MLPHLPAGFVARPPEDADRPALHALVAACSIADYGSPDEALIEGVEMTWSKPGFVHASDAWAVLAPDGRLAAYAHVGPADRAHRYAHAFVHPDFAGRGIGAWLLARTESRAREQQAASSATSGEAATLEQWIGATNHAARELLSGADYAEVRHMWGMVIALDGAGAPSELPTLPTGISIRACDGAEGDLRRAYRTTEEAFRDHWQYEPRGFAQFMAVETATERYDPSLWLLALDGDEAAGAALCEAYPARGWINTIGVRPAWRGRGIATALLRYAFAEFQQRGLREAALGVDGRTESDRRDARLPARGHVRRAAIRHLREGTVTTWGRARRQR